MVAYILTSLFVLIGGCLMFSYQRIVHPSKRLESVEKLNKLVAEHDKYQEKIILHVESEPYFIYSPQNLKDLSVRQEYKGGNKHLGKSLTFLAKVTDASLPFIDKSDSIRKGIRRHIPKAMAGLAGSGSIHMPNEVADTLYMIGYDMLQDLLYLESLERSNLSMELDVVRSQLGQERISREAMEQRTMYDDLIKLYNQRN